MFARTPVGFLRCVPETLTLLTSCLFHLRRSRYTKPSLNCPGAVNYPLLGWQLANLAQDTNSLAHFFSLSSSLSISFSTHSSQSYFFASSSLLTSTSLGFILSCLRTLILSILLSPPFLSSSHLFASSGYYFFFPLHFFLFFPFNFQSYPNQARAHHPDGSVEAAACLPICILSLGDMSR